MSKDIDRILNEAAAGRPITKPEAVKLLALPEDSLDAATLRATANAVSRRRFNNKGYYFGQVGMVMGPCEADCSFCWYGKSHTQVQPSILEYDEIVLRCKQFAAGGASGIYLITMHRVKFD